MQSRVRKHLMQCISSKYGSSWNRLMMKDYQTENAGMLAFLGNTGLRARYFRQNFCPPLP